MITIATAAAALSPPLNLRHATELRDRGYTVIPDAGISADLVKDARFAVASEFSRLLDNLEDGGAQVSRATCQTTRRCHQTGKCSCLCN